MLNNEIMVLHEENKQFPIVGRELWERLGIETPYTMWLPRMCEYGFAEGEDYVEIDKPAHKDNVIELDKVGENEFLTKMLEKENADETDENKTSSRGRKQINHALSLSMAKEICMLQRTEQGRKIRRYLIEVEESWIRGTLPQSPYGELSPQLQVLISLEQKQRETERRVDALGEKVGMVTEALQPYIPPTEDKDWQDAMRERVTNLCSKYHLYHNDVYSELYRRVEQNLHVSLKMRMTQKKRRIMKANPGAKQTQLAIVTRLNVVADDPKLRVAFERYLQEAEVKNAMKGGPKHLKP